MTNHKTQKTTVIEQEGSRLVSVANDSLADICDYLEASDIKHLQATCRFFCTSGVLEKKLFEKNDWQFFPSTSCIIVLSPQGHAFAKGSNLCNRLGTVNKFQESPLLTPVYLPNKQPIKKIIAGEENTFFFDSDGKCFYAGKNLFYSSEGKEPYLITTPQELVLPSGNKILDITLGYTNTWGESIFILDSEKNCYARIRTNRFSLDLKKINHPLELLTLPNKKKIIQIAAGAKHLIFLDEDLQCHGMGRNMLGQLGLEKSLHVKPTPIPLQKNICKILADDHQSFILTKNGEAYVAGQNYNGELGMGWRESVDEFTKVELPNNSSIVEIIASENHTFFKNEQGCWFSCGNNKNGELGHLTKAPYFNSTIKNPTLVELPNKKPIKTITPAKDYSIFVDVTGNVFKFYDRKITCLNEELNKLVDKKVVHADDGVSFVRAKP